MDSMELDHRLLRKAEAVLQWRTTRLVLVVERCTNDHNYSAILRTAEALGIQTVYMIDPPDVVDPEDVGTVLEYADNENELTQQQRKKLTVATPEELQARRMHHLFARKATEWLTVRDFASSQECVEELKELGYQLWVTDLSQHAESMTLSSPKIPEKIALVMGTEAVGCSQYMLDHADKRVYLPLRGFADSLNLSVATALILHQLFVMDPTLIGAASDEEKLTLRKAWYGKLCQQRILTAGQRKQRQKLQNMLKKCQTIHDRTQQPNALKLQPAQQRKLDEWDSYKEQLEELESLVDPAKVQTAIEEWVQNPPSPLTDVRRADVHRVCYVGKNTKTKHADDWKDMAATSNAGSIHMSSAAAFREKVKGVQ
jgi:tRNA(Leu) C34 or U34 (ribose-2'-O)-methylase TrmL